MGTRFDILGIEKSRSTAWEIWGEIVRELSRLDQVFNRFDNTSKTARINSEAVYNPVLVDTEMWEILLDCRQYNSLTKGLFDVTLKDFSQVSLDNKKRTVQFLQSDITLDFGGYAKGYALREVKKMLVKWEVRHCFVNFGDSSILGIGHHPYGDAWKVSIENPFNRNEVLGEISLRDEALSVSGNTPSYTGHIVRPDSGYHAIERKLVSIVSVDPLEAEVLSTALMIANPAEKRCVAEKFKMIKIKEYSL